MGPTDEQIAVLDDTGNIIVTAIPGSGKTYTVVKKIERIMTVCPKHRGVIAISYTNKASDELKNRCKMIGVSMNASFFGTMDKFYISQIIIQFARHITKNIPDYKVLPLAEMPAEYADLARLSLNPVAEEIELMKAALREGYIPLEKDGEIAYWFMTNIKGVREYLISRYSHIFIDEYQDCGKTQHEVFMHIVRLGIKGIAVGDKDQAIYAFDGRFPRYLLSLINEPDFSHYELSKNHRCHESISYYSMALMGLSVPLCQDKRVFKVNVDGNEKVIAQRIDQCIARIVQKYKIDSYSKVAIICRNKSTANMIYEAIQTPAKLFLDTPLDKDNSDIGRMIKRLLIGYFSDSVFAVNIAEEWFSAEYEPDKYRKALRLCDDLYSTPKEELFAKIDVFFELASMCYPGRRYSRTYKVLQEVLVDDEKLEMFAPARKDQLNILTIHKAKGLEFDAVFHMDLYEYVFTFPNQSDEDLQQAINLHYVGITRAKKVCYLINGKYRYRAKYSDYICTTPSKLISLPGLHELRNEVDW